MSKSLHNLLFYHSPITSPPPTETYTLSLHDALPISIKRGTSRGTNPRAARSHSDRIRARKNTSEYSPISTNTIPPTTNTIVRSEEHTSELQSHSDLVCRLLLEKKKNKKKTNNNHTQ